MFTISKTFAFEASHQLMQHDGICARLHGHSYSFTIEVRGSLCGDGPKRNMVLDYKDIGDAGKEIQTLLDHQHLNSVLDLDMPTAELLCTWIWDRVSKRIPDLWAIEVSETEATTCRYCPVESRLLELGEKWLDEVRTRLYQSVEVREPSECWPFTGSRDEGGYGYCTFAELKINKAHRLAAWLAGMEIEGKVVLHSCDNPPCCNPAHLSVGTHADNERDKDDKGRRLKGDDHPGAKLTETAVRALWEAYQNGGSRYPSFGLKWAIKLKVTPNQISNILSGWCWNHVTNLPKRHKGRES